MTMEANARPREIAKDRPLDLATNSAGSIEAREGVPNASGDGNSKSKGPEIPKELRSAVENCESIIVGTSKSQPDPDIIIKRDGRIIQYLRLSERNERDLKIALETGAENFATKKQADAIERLIDYSRGKNVKVQTLPTSKEHSTQSRRERQITEPSVTRPETTPSISEKGEFNRTPIGLEDILSSWLEADRNLFEDLMPQLYGKIAAPDGRLNSGKLEVLIKNKDPLLLQVIGNMSSLSKEFTGANLARKAAEVESEMPGSGNCAAAVSYAIERATGQIIYGNANDMRYSLPRYGFTETPSKELRVGQIAHVYWTPEVWAEEKRLRGDDTPNYGDIFVIGKDETGQLLALNDDKTTLADHLSKKRYDWRTMKVFEPPPWVRVFQLVKK